MIKQIGHQSLIFFTFSAVDFHWPELHKLMPNNGIIGSGSDSTERQQWDIIENPHIAAWFFNKRFDVFLKDVLIPQWDLEDYWY